MRCNNEPFLSLEGECKETVALFCLKSFFSPLQPLVETVAFFINKIHYQHDFSGSQAKLKTMKISSKPD